MKPRNGQPRLTLVQRAVFIARWSRHGSNGTLQGCRRGVGWALAKAMKHWEGETNAYVPQLNGRFLIQRPNMPRGVDPILNHRMGTRGFLEGSRPCFESAQRHSLIPRGVYTLC